jgi:hypothetical protein
MRKSVLIAVLLVALLMAFRLLGALQPTWLPNFQPLAALFFCGAACLGTRVRLVVPLAAFLVSFPLVNLILGNPGDTSGLVISLVGFGAVVGIGHLLRQRSTGVLMAGTVAASLAFYLLTNTACWLVDPLYTKGLQGFTEALWSGPAGFAQPTWVFLRNALAADVVFAGLFLWATRPLRESEASLVVAERVS